MSVKKKNPDSRHGKLSDKTAQTSITMNKELLEKCRAEAEREGRSLSNWLEQLAKNSFKLLAAALLLWWLSSHATPRG